MKKHGDKIMVKLKDLLNEVAPGYKNRQFGDPLPTLADVTKEYQEKNGVQVEEGQKREASNIMRKYDLAFLKFSREIRDVIKLVDRSTGSKVDGKIIEKAYEKGLIPLNKLMIEWDKGQQQNPGLSEELPSVEEAAPQMRTKPGQKELQAIKNKLERLKSVDISSRHYSKFISAIKSTQNTISRIEKLIRMSSTL